MSHIKINKRNKYTEMGFELRDMFDRGASQEEIDEHCKKMNKLHENIMYWVWKMDKKEKV